MEIVKSSKLSEKLEERVNNYDIEPMTYRCPKCNAKLFKAEFKSGDYYYCKTGTKQSDWEKGKYSKK